MASNFPNSIDSFVNPSYTKVNGVDYVKAEHVNDLQDATRNIEIVIAGAGLSMSLASNHYIPAASSIKTSLEILDGALKDRQTAFEEHLSFVMPTDPFQHHSNVIQVTAIGNLNSTRGQQAFEELQNDIDNIMSGGYVEGNTLDNRYILQSGSAVVTGTLSVQGAFAALANVQLGSSVSNTVIISGDTTIGRDLLVSGQLEVGQNIVMPNTSKIGAKDSFEYTNLSFLSNGIYLKSINDIIFTLDSEDAIDGLSANSKFQILNGVSSPVLTLDETGLLSVLSSIASSSCELTNSLVLGTSVQSVFEHNKIDVQSGTYTLRLDSDNNEGTSELIVTKDGDFGTLDTSTNIILKADQNQIITGNSILKRNVQEVGYFGMKFHSDNAGGKFQGYGVNFKSKMITTPSSVTLSIDPLKSSNYNNVSITDITQYGFFVQCDSLTIGHVEIKGTYTTIGN